MKILFGLFSYLMGAIPSGYIIVRLAEKKDIRNFGSRSTGATNVLRLKGLKYALPVILMDILKGFLPVFIALKLIQDKQLALICGFLAVLGHCFPVYIRFKGGKGLATTMGVYAALALKPLLLSLAIFVGIIALTRYVSLGSLLAALSFPFFTILFIRDNAVVFLGFSLFFLITLRHHENIARLTQGTERKLGEKL